jgi:hypothetical protein
MMNRKPVQVFDKQGRKVAEVSASATSIGASKVAGFPVQFGKVGSMYGWVPSQR